MRAKDRIMLHHIKVRDSGKDKTKAEYFNLDPS